MKVLSWSKDSTMGQMIDSWKLATISMWFDKVDKSEVINLIAKNFTWEDLWNDAVTVNQLCAERQMSTKIVSNRDQGVETDRIATLGGNLYSALQDLKSRKDCPIFVVSASMLENVPGVVKDNVQAEPAVTARLDNIEKMVEKLSKEIRDTRSQKIPDSWPALPNVDTASNQVNSLAVPIPGSTPSFRNRSPSVKRSSDESNQGNQQQGQELWKDVVGRKDKRENNNKRRAPRPSQQGTAKIGDMAAEAAPFNVVIGNTNPASTENIIKDVLMKVYTQCPVELKHEAPLQILEVECLTKPREDGRRIWSKTWRVQVPCKFRDYIQKPEAIPAGWTSRKYFPPRDPRPPVPNLDPTNGMPPAKKSNVGSTPTYHSE